MANGYGKEHRVDGLACLRWGRECRRGRPCYSQRNTFAESAVNTANTTASAAKSPRCAAHASPFHMPASNDTAYVSGSTFASIRSSGGSTASGAKIPQTASIGYMITAPIGCAKRAVGTILAIRKPIDRTLNVLISSAIVNFTNGT